MQNIELVVLVRKGIYFSIFDSQGTPRRTEPSLQAKQTLSLTRSAKATLPGHGQCISPCQHWSLTPEPPLRQAPNAMPLSPPSPGAASCVVTFFLHSIFETSVSFLWLMGPGSHTCYLVFWLLPRKSRTQDRKFPKHRKGVQKRWGLSKQEKCPLCGGGEVEAKRVSQALSVCIPVAANRT